jgi:uncharacterized membrane protein
MKDSFLIGEAITFGWHKTKAHNAVLFQAMLAMFAVQVAMSIVDKVLGGTAQGFLATIALVVTSVIIGTGFTVITLRVARGEATSIKDLIPKAALVWQYFLASLLSTLIIVAGLILLIVPGIYLAMRLSMVRFAILDGAGIKESLKKSSKLTEGVKWRLLLFFLALGGLNILGALALLVGLLVTVPVSAIAFAHVYQKLKSHHA